jgi:hypothetical protein
VNVSWPAAEPSRNRGYAAAVVVIEPPQRTLVVVAGSGRSGTSLFTGILQRLGFHVPQPEVPADPTNPRGFAESQWVVDFHARQLRRARVQVSDARPAAWALTAQAGLDADVRRELLGWLDRQFETSDDVIVKDPRLSWFLPLWLSCARELRIAPKVVTLLRHPAAVIDSKQRWYGEWQGDVARAAGWVHQTLYTERATRGTPRAFVRYDDVLADWPAAVARVGAALELARVRDAPAAAMRDVHGFVDRSLARSRADWGDLKLPARLREQADEVWDAVCALADAPAADGAARLDALRAEYVDLYAEAEAIAQSSIAAARTRNPVPATRMPSPVLGAVRRVPRRYRHSVPLRWRVRIASALAR